MVNEGSGQLLMNAENEINSQGINEERRGVDASADKGVDEAPVTDVVEQHRDRHVDNVYNHASLSPEIGNINVSHINEGTTSCGNNNVSPQGVGILSPQAAIASH